MDKLTAENMNNDGLMNLVVGIVNRATEDWNESMNTLNEASDYFGGSEWFEDLRKQTSWEKFKIHIQMANKLSKSLNYLQDAEQFFLSKWFVVLTDLDGKTIVRKLKDDYFKSRIKKQKKGRF